MSRCGLDLWPLELELLQHFGCYVFKLCTKTERNRIIHGWVIDDWAHFRRPILRVGALSPDGSSYGFVDRTSLNLGGHRARAIINARRFCFRVQLSCSVSNTQRQVMAKLKFEFRTKWVTCCRQFWITHLMGVLSAVAESREPSSGKKKERKAAFIKAFRHTCRVAQSGMAYTRVEKL